MNSEANYEVDTLSLPLFSRTWLAPVLLLAAGSAAEAAYGGYFGHDWVLRMLLLAAVPLVMVDRLAILRSYRAREILGKRFWIYAANAFGAYWSTLMIFVMWPSLTNFHWGFTIWLVMGAGLGLFEARRHKVQMPDLADQYLDLEKFQTGNWFVRTGYIWWVPSMALLLLAMVWTQNTPDGQAIFSERYLIIQVFMLLVFLGFHPDRKPILKSKMYWTRLLGTSLFLIAILADYAFQ